MKENGGNVDVSGDSIYWKFDDAKPSQLPPNPLLCALVPRPTAWICVECAGGSKSPLVALVEGYSGAADRPPTVMMASTAMPPSIMDLLRRNKLCSLSVATEREQDSLRKAAAVDDAICGPALTFAEAGLEPSVFPLVEDKCEHTRPPSVKSSPIKMHCRLALEESLPAGQSMILLQIETFEILGSVLVKQNIKKKAAVTIQGNPDVRTIAAKIKAELVRPVASLGGGRFGVFDRIYHMLRPLPNQQPGGGVQWVADTFKKAPPIHATKGNYSDITYTYREENSCKLGYNPTKQSVLPRCIGWISSYASLTHTPNLSPYSFFCEVGRGPRPFIAFAACPKTDGTDWKDAHRDAMETGVFAFNITTKKLAEAMNMSSAPCESSVSEFELAGLKYKNATSIDAPVLEDSPIVFECRYVTTIKVPEIKPKDSKYYLIVGEVLSIDIDKNILDDKGMVDIGKLQPVARLGYGQEYAVVDKLLNI